MSTADYSKDLSHLFKEKKQLNTIIQLSTEITNLISDNISIFEDLSDADFFDLFEENIIRLCDQMNLLYKHNLDKLKFAKNHCYIQFKPSTGGTESENLAFVMFKNYLKMLEDKMFDFELIECDLNGNQLLKNAIIKIESDYAFGQFYSEKGVHRFTRVSPYGNGKLHTSFVFVDVYPHIEFESQNHVSKNDVRIDTFRGSGAGGQHKNVTDSAIRLTHKETGIVVKIENERSQHQNKKIAFDILAAKLYELELKKQTESSNQNKGKDSFQDWGSQIRSYTIEQNRIKDHRTNIEYNGNLNHYFNNLFEFIIKNNSEILISL